MTAPAPAGAGLDPDELSFGAFVNCTANPDMAAARQVILGAVGVFAHFSGMAGADTSGLEDASVFDSVALRRFRRGTQTRRPSPVSSASR